MRSVIRSRIARWISNAYGVRNHQRFCEPSGLSQADMKRVVEKSRRCIDGDDAGVEIDVDYDLGNVRHEELAPAAADDEPPLARPLIDPGHLAELFTLPATGRRDPTRWCS